MPWYKNVRVSPEEFELLKLGKARLYGTTVVINREPYTKANPKPYGRKTYQVEDKYLRKIYGKGVTQKRTFRKIYNGARTPSGKIQEYLKPLGADTKIRYEKKNGKIATRTQTLNYRRYIGNLKYNSSGQVIGGIKSGTDWQTQSKKRLKGIHGVNRLTPESWIIHLTVAKHQMEINSSNFLHVMIRNAKTIFSESFTQHRFKTKGSKGWKELSENTIKLRRRRGVWHNSILNERGMLKNSLDLQFSFIPGAYMGAVVTKQVPDRDGKMVCYAAIHNEGGYPQTVFGKYPFTSEQRQFMGHSSYIEQFAISIRDKYFLNDVFLMH